MSIASFGALADGTLQSGKIQAAIDFCFLHGGGEVKVPAGEYQTGGLRLRSKVTLYLSKGAVLRGSRNPEDYLAFLRDEVEPVDPSRLTAELWQPAGRSDRSYAFMRKAGSRWNNALIRAIDAEDVGIVGEEGSVLDGSDCFDETGEEHYRGPHCISLHNCRKVSLKGYTVRNSANWAHALFQSQDITAERITVLAGHDGIHLSSCDKVRIEHCCFQTGDDCVAGFDNNTVVVQDCELNTACSGLRFGGHGVLVDNCRFYGPAKYLFRGSLTADEKRTGVQSAAAHRFNMLSAFTYYSDFSLDVRQPPGDITIRNCTIENTDRLLHYNFSGNEPWQKNRPLHDVRFEKITASGVSMPLDMYGDAKAPVTVEIRDMDFTFRKGFSNVSFIHACNFERITLERVRIRGIEGSPLIKTWSAGKVEIKGVSCELPEQRWIVPATEPFFSKAI